MNKKLFALAIISAASAASAQSSLTLYGVVDASVESIKADDSVTRVSSDNLASSRFGLKGTEDLGGGLKALFNLEASLKTDTGAADSTRFFGRQAWVGLSGGFGELRLGRTDSSIGALAGNTGILGAQDYDDFKIAKTLAGDKYRRVDNSITYFLPKLVNGLTAQVQYSAQFNGSEIAGNKTGRLYGLNAQYAAGGFGAGAAYLEAKTNNVGGKDKSALAYLSYDFSVAKVTGYYNRNASATLEGARELFGARFDVPLGNAFALQASVSRARDYGDERTDADSTIVALKGIYSLSKRTSVYALATTVSNGDNANIKVGSSAPTLTDGERASGFALGVSHKF
ncbi:porin [Aquabacterium sp. G14]|uniref:porin n=1 Tax=Aquabacterium sp. G14 TaxID=3130164 RepID=UPI00309FF418